MNLRGAVERVVGVVLIDDELVEQCRTNVKMRCETVDVSKYRRRQAQEALEAEAKLAIVDTFSDRNGRNYRVGNSWPGALATIHKDDTALIDIDIGVDHTDDGDGVDVVKIKVFRSVRRSGLADMLKGLVGVTRKAEAPLDLTQKIETPPAAPAKRKSSARELLDGNKR